MKEISNNEAKGNKKPWKTSAIRRSVKAKKHLLKTFLKNKDQFYYHRYKYNRDKPNHLIRDSKKQYYTKFFNKNIENMKKCEKKKKLLTIIAEKRIYV